jgi:hypothetical protein
MIPSISGEAVNRSLSWQELQIMAFVNGLLKKSSEQRNWEICKEISNSILRSAKPHDSTIVVSSQELQLLEKKERNVVNYVNEFAKRDFELKIKSDKIVVGERDQNSETGMSSAYRAVIASLIDHRVTPEAVKDAEGPSPRRRRLNARRDRPNPVANQQ